MGQIIVNGGTPIQDYYPGVTVNGTAVQQVVVNGTTIWTRYPYPPGTTLFTFSWSPGQYSYFTTFVTSVYPAYPLAFAAAPVFYNATGPADSGITFTLASGFAVTVAHQDQQGTQTNSTTGGSYAMQVGNSITGVEGTGFSFSSTGNGGAYFTVAYLGN